MGLSAFAAHVTTVAGLVISAALAARYLMNSVLRLVAGMVAIMAHDERSRADRALDVLRLLRRAQDQY
jgi:hypothetical protein